MSQLSRASTYKFYTCMVNAPGRIYSQSPHAKDEPLGTMIMGLIDEVLANKNLLGNRRDRIIFVGPAASRRAGAPTCTVHVLLRRETTY